MIYYIISLVLFVLSLLTAITIAISKFKILWNSKEKIILLLLFITLIFELISHYILWRYWSSPARVMDLLRFISILIIIWWFYLYLKKKYFLAVSIIITIIAFTIDVIYNQNLKTQLPISSIASAIVVLSSVFALLKMLLLSDINNHFKKLRPFWIAMGFLVFEIISMTMILFLPKLSRMDWELNLVISFMNIVLYGCIAYALSLNENYER